MDVLCIGQAATDILIKSVNNLDFKIDTIKVDQITMKNGGDATNVAINLSELGIKVGYTGVFGNDIFGKYLKQTLKSHRINISGLKIEENIPTSVAVALINDCGERKFLYYGGSNDLFSFQHINKYMIKRSKIVHISGTYVLPKFDGEGTEKVLKIAKEFGKITSMDVTTNTRGRWLEIIDASLKYLDYFLPSYNEAREITGQEEPEKIAEFLIKRGVKVVVVKLGNEGCYIHGPNGGEYQKAYNVEAVDTTGAGDSFVAGFLAGIISKKELHQCARIASAVAAHCVQKIGATGGVPKLSKVLKFIKTNNL